MNTIASKQITIIQALSQLPEAKLDQAKIYLDELLGDDQRVSHQNQSLKGIWRIRLQGSQYYFLEKETNEYS